MSDRTEPLDLDRLRAFFSRMAEIQTASDLNGWSNKDLTLMVGLMPVKPEQYINYDNQHTEQWD